MKWFKEDYPRITWKINMEDQVKNSRENMFLKYEEFFFFLQPLSVHNWTQASFHVFNLDLFLTCLIHISLVIFWKSFIHLFDDHPVSSLPHDYHSIDLLHVLSCTSFQLPETDDNLFVLHMESFNQQNSTLTKLVGELSTDLLIGVFVTTNLTRVTNHNLQQP